MHDVLQDDVSTHVYDTHKVFRFRKNAFEKDDLDNLASESAVALVYNGIAHTVLMCSATELEYLAIGFSLSEGIIQHYRDIHDIEVVYTEKGIELHIELCNRCFEQLKHVRRTMAGRTGCGICGTEQLDQVVRPLSTLGNQLTMDIATFDHALQQLKQHQRLNRLTGATHAAAYISQQGEIVVIQEDIGRHIALDKLIGYIVKHRLTGGAILVTSRASFEMVQKAVIAGVEILFAISAATMMAVELAQQANLTLVGFCRPGRADVYTHPERVTCHL